MTEKIIIREATAEDYPSFRRMEEIAWANTGIKPIEEDVFLTWLEVFSEGLLLALVGGNVVGHIYSQICDFNPLDKTDNRNLNKMTDCLYTKNTHNLNCDCVYVVSISSVYGGAGTCLLKYMLNFTKRKNKKYYSGVCRMSGLNSFLEKKGIQVVTSEIVDKYARQVYLTSKSRTKIKQRDPVMSRIFLVPELKYFRVIQNFLTDPQSLGWSCVAGWVNTS